MFSRDDKVMGLDEPQEAIRITEKFLPLDKKISGER